jgi:hypothetical protein
MTTLIMTTLMSMTLISMGTTISTTMIIPLSTPMTDIPTVTNHPARMARLSHGEAWLRWVYPVG